MRSRTGESVVVTKNGNPIAELVPYKPKPKNARGIWKGQVEIIGDIMSPIDVEWARRCDLARRPIVLLGKTS